MDKITVLTSMAFLFDNNPIDVFTKFTKYCISKYSVDEVININEIRTTFSDFFGFPVPLAILRICLNRLKKDSVIRLTENNEYRVIDTSIDISTLRNAIEQYQNQEKKLVEGFCCFASSKYHISIDVNEAERLIDDFLTRDGRASKLFFDNNVTFGITTEEVSKRLVVPKTYYLAKYFDSLLNQNCPERDYLESVITGIIAYIGVSSIGESSVQTNYRGTRFFFDTKLVLRLLGISFDFSIDAAKELLNEIKTHKGCPAIFEHTLDEITGAFDTAIGKLKYQSTIEDSEFAYYCEKINNDINILRVKKENLRNSIIEKGFEIISDNRLEDSIRWCLPWKEAIEFITNAHPNWKSQAIENDIKSLNDIHILRNGNYQKLLGGHDKLPIFITSNTALIKTMKEMVNSSESYELERKNFPFVSDVELMSIIWFPHKDSSLPKLALARNVHAVCNDTYAFRKKLRENGERINSLLNNDLTIESIRGLWTSKVMDQYILNSSSSDNTQEDDALIVTSIDEVVKMHSINDRRKIIEKEQEIKNLNKSIESEKVDKSILINKIASGFKISLGLRIYICFLKNCSLIVSIILSLIEFFITLYLMPSLDSIIRIAIAVFLIVVGVIIRNSIDKKRMWGKKDKLIDKIKIEISQYANDSIPNAIEIRELCLSIIINKMSFSA